MNFSEHDTQRLEEQPQEPAVSDPSDAWVFELGRLFIAMLRAPSVGVVIVVLLFGSLMIAAYAILCAVYFLITYSVVGILWLIGAARSYLHREHDDHDGW